MRAPWISVALVVGTLSFSSCSPPAPACNAQTCPGCCDTGGTCNLGNSNLACGAGASVCRACSGNESCTLGVCVPASSIGGGMGGGGATGGGGASGGGGGGSNGGGGGAIGGGAGGGRVGTDCVEDSDCPDPLYFFCDTIISQCVPGCRTTAQCNPQSLGGTRPATYALDFCAAPLGCQCDEGRCLAALCSADSDCGAQACRSGACVPQPAASSVARCEISPSFAVLRAGSATRFHVLAWDATNNPMVFSSGATWSSIGSSVTGSGQGLSAVFTASGAASTTPAAAVRASFGSVTCEARAVVLANPAAGQVAVSVIDELTGRPLAGAKVMLSSVAGAVINQGASATVDTDSNGYALLTLTGSPASYSVSAFHPDFSYLTVANYAGTTRFLSMALRRNPLDTYGGYKGSFRNVPMTSNVHQGRAATSFAGDVTRTSAAQVDGPFELVDVVIGSAINQMEVPMPAGSYVGFGDQPIKSDLAALGLNGTCVATGGGLDETRIGAGSCGTRSAWALTADVPLGDIPIDAFAGGLDNANWPALVPRLTPILKRLNSSLVRDVEFTLRPTPLIDAGVPNYSDKSQYTTVTHDFTQLPAAFDVPVRLPTLPRLKGVFVPGAMALGGASVAGRGVVALGMGLAVDEAPIDGVVNVSGLPNGRMRLRAAPTHHGLEGAPYGVLVGALSNRCLKSAASELFFLGGGSWRECEGLSALVARLPNNRWFFDPAAATPLDLSTQTFPPYPEGARFNFSSFAVGPIPARGFRVPTAIAGMDVARVTFTDAYGAQWEVLVDAASPNFTLPPVPGTLRDRVFAFGSNTARSELGVTTLRLRRDPAVSTSAPVTFSDFVELNEWSATTELLTGFSSLNYGSPKVAFTTPSSSPTILAAGARLVLKVENFSIGNTVTNDGVVRLTFSGGAGCTAATLSTEVPTAGSGVLEHTLPSSCTGSNVSIRAELVGIDGVTPLAPAVARTITATIQ